MSQNSKRKRDNDDPTHNDKLVISVSDVSRDASEEDNDMLDTPSSVSSMPPFGNSVNVAPAHKKTKSYITSINEDPMASSPDSSDQNATISEEQKVEIGR